MKSVTGGKWIFLLGKGWLYTLGSAQEPLTTGEIQIDGKEYMVKSIERGQDLRIGKSSLALVIDGTPKLWN